MVDLSTLKVGDKILGRDGVEFIVGSVSNLYDDVFAVTTTEMRKLGLTSDYYSTHNKTGKCLVRKRACPGDIVHIIPAAPAPVPPPASDARTPVPDSQPSVAECGEALRFNQGKTPYGNLPLDLLDGAARVMAKGEAKYSRANYRKGYNDLLSPVHSLLRHAAALQAALEQGQTEEGGPMYDAETGECHAHHVITSALLLVQTMRVKGLKV